MLNYLKNPLFLVVITLTVSTFAGIKTVNAVEEEHQQDLLRGNVVCLLIDKDKKSVIPKIGTQPCNNAAPHPHGFVDKSIPEGKFYYIEGTPKAIEELEKTSDRDDVELTGVVSGDENSPVITIK
ncbi:MAG: hypothetical protein ACR2NW_07525 [Thermodesulfobacteriota bacterium]